MDRSWWRSGRPSPEIFRNCPNETAGTRRLLLVMLHDSPRESKATLRRHFGVRRIDAAFVFLYGQRRRHCLKKETKKTTWRQCAALQVAPVLARVGQWPPTRLIPNPAIPRT